MLQVIGIAHEGTLECIATGECVSDEATVREVAAWAIREIYSLRKQILEEKEKYLDALEKNQTKDT